MAVDVKLYTDRFFQEAKRLAGPSAAAFVSILIDKFSPKSVVDIGCGNGLYLKEFAERGIEIYGYDGAPAAVEATLVGDKIKLHDLCQPLDLNRKFDLCLCVEVAEHLPLEAADTLIDTLTTLADIIVFTAAVPGQAPLEYGHINEQPHAYWVKKFTSRKFRYCRSLSLLIRKKSAERSIVWWLVNNIMVFKKLPKLG